MAVMSRDRFVAVMKCEVLSIAMYSWHYPAIRPPIIPTGTLHRGYHVNGNECQFFEV